MTKDYTSKDIRVMDEISHVRLNAGMYIGSTETPTHLIEEALDNSLDEALAGHATIVAININTKDHIFSVMDNGRGIPFENDIPITISTKLFSGAKFQDSKSAYAICSGLHGVGLVAVNALSNTYEVEVYREGKKASFRFENAKIKEKRIDKFDGAAPFSTKITFKPDKKIFQKLTPDLDRLRRRLLTAAVELNDCLFVLNIDGKRETIKLTEEQFFDFYCLGDYKKEKDNTTELIKIHAKDANEQFNILFAYSMSSMSPRVISSVNLLPVDNAGTHVNMFFDVIKDFFTNKSKKNGFVFQPADALSGLRAYISLELVKPEFSGQSKEKLINRKEYLDKLIIKVKQGIESYFNENKELQDKLLAFFDDYRRRQDAKKIKKGSDGFGKRFSTKFTKLRDCSSDHGELFIVEGDSALGSIQQCRDPRSHAIFPLKGKIPSIVTAKDILKNAEIGELIQSLGTGVGPAFDINKLKYNKIICATDADADGGHIFCLLTMTLANLVPEIIQKGHYYLARTPLYAISKGKEFIPIWSDDELEKARKTNSKILRFKGLGELDPWQMKICALDHKTRKLIKVDFTKDLNVLMKLFSDVQCKRDLLEGKI